MPEFDPLIAVAALWAGLPFEVRADAWMALGLALAFGLLVVAVDRSCKARDTR